MVRWLHISDLHINNKVDWKNFKKELFNKCGEIGKIDLLIVTGDFQNFSDKSDFGMSKDFLLELIEKLGLNIESDLFLVPGNHDGTTKIEDKKLYVSAIKNSPLDFDEKWLSKLLEAFDDYESFVKNLIPNYKEEHPASVHNRIWKNKINFIHCNTAIAADGNEKVNQLLDVDGVASVFFSEDMPNIILAHNSFFDLNSEQQKRMKDVIRNNQVCAYFCGDRHIGDVGQIEYEENQNKQIPCVASYKTAPEPKDTYSTFGIIIGEWEKRIATLKGWIWKSGEGFKIDEKITEKKIDMKRESEDTSFALAEMEKQNKKRLWCYTVIIVDDVEEQLEMLREEVENLFDTEERYSVRVLAASKSSDVIITSQNIDIDVFVLDVVRNESLKLQTSKFDYFGYDLYKILANEKPNVLVRSEFFVLSRLPISTLRNEFDGANVTYLRKQTTSNAEVAKLIKECLDKRYLQENMNDDR